MRWYRFDIILTLFVSAFFFGIFIAYQGYTLSYFLTQVSIIYILIGVFSFLIIFFFFKKLRLFLIPFLLVLLSMCVGVIRFHIDEVTHVSQMKTFIGQNVSVSGYVIDSPEQTDYNMRFTLRLDTGEKVLVTSTKSYPLVLGSHVNVYGNVQRGASFITNTDRVFDYAKYLRRVYIEVIVRAQNIEIDESLPLCCRVSRFLGTVRDMLVSRLETTLPQTESGFMAGLLFGVNRNLDPNLKQAFVTTGTIHMIALSGYNVTIVANAIIKLARTVFSRVGAYMFGAFGIIFFVFMTGGSQTAIRAGLMSLVLLIAKSTGRAYNAFRALLYVGFGMVMLHPRILLFDLSFQLSFLATASIILYTPLTSRWVRWMPTQILRETLAGTLAAQILVTPWILYTIGNLSFISPLANLVMLPLVPLGMLFGTLLIIVAHIIPSLAFLFAYPSYIILAIIEQAAFIFSRVPYASTTVLPFGALPLVGVYVCLLGLLWFSPEEKDNSI